MISIQTGSAAYAPEAGIFDADHFGYNYTGFRAFSRFDNQLAGSKVGMITWPGGSLAENGTSKFGLEYDGLWNGPDSAGNLPELMAYARDNGATLAVVLPTLRYAGRYDVMRADVRGFMADLLGGAYGPLPENMILEIGSEFYSTFKGMPNPAQLYGDIADTMIREIQSCLDDPKLNVLDNDLGIAIQGGRNINEDAMLRGELSDETFRSVDMVIHHRFAVMATGVDKSADQIGDILDAWEHDSEAAGGERPELFLGTYNVASYTRGEALGDYLKLQEGQGAMTYDPAVDLAGRTDDDFENFYQHKLERYDYGAEHPRVLLEMMAEYGAEGMGAAGTYGSDMQHVARLTYTDVNGAPVKFVGQDMLDMMAESVDDTHLLQTSLTNDARDDIWVYGYENDDKLVVFLSGSAKAAGKVALNIGGLGDTYHAVWGDSLTAQVPSDWMTRFGIPDNPNVDETAESRSFALGVRSAVVPTIEDGQLTVNLDDPHEVIRLSFAKTAAGAEEIAGFAHGPAVDLDGVQPMLMDAHGDFPAVDFQPLDDDDMADDADDLNQMDDSGFAGSGMAMGLAALILPLLAMAGGM
ncbi:MAG: hypothetical protein CFE34_16665 [Rhodobacteraceae bacterium PARR1]|nr:MAG: hypothetical protein CFE34_16665 [Rhodobacteraceae bacterium PARR1]